MVGLLGSNARSTAAQRRFAAMRRGSPPGHIDNLIFSGVYLLTY